MYNQLDLAEAVSPIVLRKESTSEKISRARKGHGRPCKLTKSAHVILEQRQRGASLRELAKHWDVSTSTILRALAIAAKNQ